MDFTTQFVDLSCSLTYSSSKLGLYLILILIPQYPPIHWVLTSLDPYNLLEIDLNYGNYSVLLANIGVLTASSFLLTVGHLRTSVVAYGFTAVLACIFLLNQVDELFSNISISSVEETSLVLLCLYTHLSHLVVSLIVFLKIISRTMDWVSDVQVLFVSAYWHFVEVVWILILMTLVGF